MEERRFDALVTGLTVTSRESRRRVVQALGMSGLGAVLGRLVAAVDAEAKKKRKKRKKCKNGTTRCGKKACCRADQICSGGQCVPFEPGCRDDLDCNAGEFCVNGSCVPECDDNADCNAGEFCVGGACVPIAGTCAATDDHCAVNEALCNEGGEGDCFCLQRFGGGAACIQVFVPGSTCGDCASDADCDAIEPRSICVSPVENGCPCQPGQGICARLCPTPA